MATIRKSVRNDSRKEDVRRLKRKIRKPELDPRRVRKELCEYFESRQRRLDVVATTRTSSGQTLDWLPIESQVRRGRIVSPPSQSVPLRLGNGTRKVRPVTFELEAANVRRGPEGTVPIPRRNLQRLTVTKGFRRD